MHEITVRISFCSRLNSIIFTENSKFYLQTLTKLTIAKYLTMLRGITMIVSSTALVYIVWNVLNIWHSGEKQTFGKRTDIVYKLFTELFGIVFGSTLPDAGKGFWKRNLIFFFLGILTCVLWWQRLREYGEWGEDRWYGWVSEEGMLVNGIHVSIVYFKKIAFFQTVTPNKARRFEHFQNISETLHFGFYLRTIFLYPIGKPSFLSVLWQLFYGKH